MFAVDCRYNSNYKRADGGAKTVGKGVPVQRRAGAWTVANCYAWSEDNHPVKLLFSTVSVLCPTPRKIGTRVNPRALLREYWELQRHFESARNRCA